MVSDKMIQEYVNGASLHSIEVKYGIDLRDMHRALRLRGIHIRNRDEQNLITHGAGKFAVNHAYFDELDETKAYYLGFLAARVLLRDDNNEIRLSLPVICHDFLTDFAKAIEYGGQIRFSVTNSGYEIAQLKFTSKHMKQTLAKHSIRPHKTRRKMTMENVPTEFRGAFVKGYYDGNGVFDALAGTVSIPAYRRELLDELMMWFDKKSSVVTTNKDEQYAWQLDRASSMALLAKFYDMDTPCLEYKREKFYALL